MRKPNAPDGTVTWRVTAVWVRRFACGRHLLDIQLDLIIQ